MPKFRKRPVIVEAIQYLGPQMVTPSDPIPKGCCSCVIDPGLRARLGDGPRPVHVHSLEGAMSVKTGAWIITGVKGEVYPCDPDIFLATYELVDEDYLPQTTKHYEDRGDHECG